MSTARRSVPRIVVALAVLAMARSALMAGPPLVCWKVETGGAPSLPWTDNPRSYDGTSADYDTKRLAEDTLALLSPDAPALARMETLRRASLYATRDRKEGEDLLSRLIARARESEAAGKPDALALFDAGYLVETARQADGKNQPHFWSRTMEALGVRPDREKELGGTTGYDWVRRAIELSGGNPEMEYAAALITWYPRRPEHDGHLARAAAGAPEGSLLGKNLLKHFQDRGRTVAELRALGPGTPGSGKR